MGPESEDRPSSRQTSVTPFNIIKPRVRPNKGLGVTSILTHRPLSRVEDLSTDGPSSPLTVRVYVCDFPTKYRGRNPVFI